MPELLLIYEPESACRARLESEGHAQKHIREISSYLAQSTEFEPEFDLIASACRERGLAFRPVALDEAPAALAAADPGNAIVWTATDGIAYYRGSVAPGIARLMGFRTIGPDDSLFALCQDKFRSGAVLKALGLPVPDTALARNGVWITPPPTSTAGFFVKPNRLGSKIGIWEDSRCDRLDQALDLSRRVYDAYRDDVIVQPYVPGRNVRSSFLAVAPDAGAEVLGSYLVDSGSDFQTMSDSLRLYGETGAAIRLAGIHAEPQLLELAGVLPEADRRIRAIADVLMSVLGLRDVFSMDLRVGPDGSVHFLEFEVCPGLTGFDFRGYCMAVWGLALGEAIAETAARRLRPIVSTPRPLTGRLSDGTMSLESQADVSLHV